jgi:hypothetical protein
MPEDNLLLIKLIFSLRRSTGSAAALQTRIKSGTDTGFAPNVTAALRSRRATCARASPGGFVSGKKIQ